MNIWPYISIFKDLKIFKPSLFFHWYETELPLYYALVLASCLILEKVWFVVLFEVALLFHVSFWTWQSDFVWTNGLAGLAVIRKFYGITIYFQVLYLCLYLF